MTPEDLDTEIFSLALSMDDVRDMLDANELSPRFDEDEDEDEESDPMDDFNYVGSRHHY